MKLALKEANKAYTKKEVPVGAIIVKNNIILAKAHNQKEFKKDPTGHAEILSIKKASKKLSQWRLNGCDLYVTLEPCPMCAGAILQARIRKVYIGTKDIKSGSVNSVIKIFDIEKFNHKVEYEFGILENECSKILKLFFKELRNNKKS
jgi:tRNA(adenine34) deaminase